MSGALKVAAILGWFLLAVLFVFFAIKNVREGNDLRAAVSIVAAGWAIHGYNRSGE